MTTNPMSLESITTGPTTRPPRIVLLGREKIGKSTFASQAPAPVFIPILGEEGLDAIEAAKFPAATSFEEVMQALKSVHDGEHDFETVVIDSASALEPLIWRHTCKENRWSSMCQIEPKS